MLNLGIVKYSIQVITLVIALAVYRKHKTKFLSYLCYFLVGVVTVEGYGLYHKFFRTGVHTIGVYNAFVFFELIVITLMYKSIIKSKGKQRLITVLVVLFLIVYSLSFLIKSLLPFHLYPLLSLVIALIVVLYLAELLQSDKILDYRKHLPFWISVAFFTFYLSSIPFFAMYKYMNGGNMFYILDWLVVFMYSMIIFGLLWSNTKEKY